MGVFMSDLAVCVQNGNKNVSIVETINAIYLQQSLDDFYKDWYLRGKKLEEIYNKI